MIKSLKRLLDDYKQFKWARECKFKKQDIKDEELLAKYANQLIDNPIYIYVINEIETDLINIWKSTTVADAQQREMVYTLLKAAQKIDARIRYYASLNKYAPTQKGVQKED